MKRKVVYLLMVLLLCATGCRDGKMDRDLNKLESEDPFVCYTTSDGVTSYIEPKFYVDGFNWNYDHLPWVEMQNSGKLVFIPNWDAKELTVAEDYYEGTSSVSTRHILRRNIDGVFELDVTYKNPGEEEMAVYFIQGEGEEYWSYVMKIYFG